jgi:poly(3-hydroxybutyrate) depolymerase
MKKTTLFLICLISVTIYAQSPCSSGRYAFDFFQNFTLSSNIVYGQNTSWNGASTSLKLDVYQPTGDTETKRPMIIFVHGGSFIAGTKTDGDMVTMCQRFAKKGYVTASINYRLGNAFDSVNAVKAVVRAVQDLRAAVRFFYKDKQTTDTYKIDTNNIYVGGSSAGAITALHLAYLNQECEVSDYLSQATITQLGGLEGTSGNPGYSSKVRGVLNGCGALARYSWLEAGDVPVASVHGTNDATVKYNRGIVNPGIPIIYLDGSRMIHERACALGLENQFYTFPNAPHVPYAGSTAYMDTTINFFRDFLIKQLGCTDNMLQLENARMQTVFLYPINYCDGSPVNEVCSTSSISEISMENIQVYPVPTSGELIIKVTDEGLYHLRIIDLFGRTLLVFNSSSLETSLDLSLFEKGSYILRITNQNGQTETKTIIVN